MLKTENGQLVEMTQEEINALQLSNAKLAEDIAGLSATQYKRDRAAAYPAIGDQLDALFHAGVFPADMAATLQAIKTKYPKPE
jgi:hypothetical protein